ncbi:MAG: hypothetical protein JO261_06690 [Alphaproteobacteria bacterium]|nr:hypothetical protein [Alphaproteobacteria bacterium]MBV9693371.1 hypothetical protein [Alphaproteobacteria bacterium]
MSENRKRILDLLAQGRVTADEAERLLAALESTDRQGSSATAAAEAKYLRVQIEADDKDGGETRAKVNIRVPLRLLKAGVRLASLLPPEARDQMNAALREKGVGLDIDRIKPENLDELIRNLNDVSIDVASRQGRRATIRVFCE